MEFRNIHCCLDCPALTMTGCQLKEVPVIVTFTKGILFDLDDFSFRRYNQGDRVAGIAKIKEDEVYCVRIEEDFLPSIFLNYFRLSQKGSIARA